MTTVRIRASRSGQATSAVSPAGAATAVAARRAAMEQAGVMFIDEIHRIHVHEGQLGPPAGTEEWMTFFHDSEGNLAALCEYRT